MDKKIDLKGYDWSNEMLTGIHINFLTGFLGSFSYTLLVINFISPSFKNLSLVTGYHIRCLVGDLD